MTHVQPAAASATSVALTKFRVPRVRRDALAREALVARLRDSVESFPLTVVVAPAGFGKTTTLSRLVAAVGEMPVAWISLDEDDDDPGRLFANLVRAVEPMQLRFEEDTAALVAGVSGGGPGARAAIGAFVNACCTSTAARILIVLDDVHRLAHPDVLQLLEALVERLPDHVSIVLAGRSLPALPVARWTIHGEAQEFGPADLRFDASDARALAATRPGGALDPESAERLLERSGGWPAGFAMLLRTPDPVREDAGNHPQLFDYLAAEVLASLPTDLQRFATEVSVLAELTPIACAELTGRRDAAALLRELYERDLFVALLDPALPALRFHDLFRSFLRARLARDDARLRELHRRAARIEPYYGDAVAHWIAAGEWGAALERLHSAADALLAEGGHAAVERWLARFPAGVVEAMPAWHYLQGLCAWRRWDWFGSRRSLQRAVELFGPETPTRLQARALLYLMGSRNGLGDRQGAQELVAQVARLPLEDAERALLALQRAWCRMAEGDCGGAVADLREASAGIARDPVRLGPPTADAAHSLYVGLPGALAVYRELLGSYAAAVGDTVAPWQGAPAIIEGWLGIWQGDPARTAAAIERAHDILRRFGSIPPLADGLARLEAMFLGLTGRGAAGVAMLRGLVARFDAPQAAPLRAAFESAYVHGLARVAWASGDREALLGIASRASRPRAVQEWAFVDLAARAVPAQAALLQGDWARAAAGFEALLPAYETLRFPMCLADPRLGLAHARLRQGRTAEALRLVEVVLDECLAEDSVGMLLLEPDWLTVPLLAALPATRRGDARVAGLLERLSAWRGAATPEVAAASSSGPLAALTEREREVLARVKRGASNKEIARALDLSLHTVKRHVANILGKLDCVSRRQATELARLAGLPD